ncbi:ATP-grasp fold amidoligase family protein [Amaricoccus solimangrovi]|nr:ATP-grasp fold amidoligase family protein [Amaricoccus solimangrovi]
MPRYDADRDAFVARIDRQRRWLGRGAKLLKAFGMLRQPVQETIYERVFSSELEMLTYAYARKNDHLPDLVNPTWYNEKVRWQFLHHPNPLMSLVADKIAVRDYVRYRGGCIQPPRLIAQGWTPRDLAGANLPARFVLKTSFGSGQNHIERGETPTRRSDLVAKLARWMGYDQWRSTGEFHYRAVPKRWLVEEYVPSAPGGQLEYKIFCMMGEPVFILVVKGRNEHGYRRNLYTPDWKPTAFHWKGFPVDPEPVPRPDRLEDMLADARLYARDFMSVRVDFFGSAGGRFDFSELTFASAAARVPFTPEEVNVRLGDMIDLSRADEYLEHGKRIAAELGWPPER